LKFKDENEKSFEIDVFMGIFHDIESLSSIDCADVFLEKNTKIEKSIKDTQCFKIIFRLC
jgi:hypothetical protein